MQPTLFRRAAVFLTGATLLVVAAWVGWFGVRLFDAGLGGFFGVPEPISPLTLAGWWILVCLAVLAFTYTWSRDERRRAERAADATAPTADDTADDTADTEPAAASHAAVAARFTEAMGALLGVPREQLHVRTASGDDGGLTAFALSYPPAAVVAVRDNLVDILDITGRISPARAGRWSLRPDFGHDRFVLADAPDPLAVDVALPPADVEPDYQRGVVIGVTEGGGQWRVPLMGGRQTLVAGATGSGKGSVLWGIIRALEGPIATRHVRLWIADPKGGAEFYAAEPYAHHFAVTPDEVTAMLLEATKTMTDKAAALGRAGTRKMGAPTRDVPLDLVIIDEIAAVAGNAAVAGGRQNGTLLNQLLSQGRAPGFTVVAAVQDPRKENLSSRGLFTGAIALRLNEAGETNLVLGQGARASGAVADIIPEDLPGVGYAVVDGIPGFTRARAAYISEEEAAAIADRIALARTPAARPSAALEVGEPAFVAAATPITDLDSGDRFRIDDGPVLVLSARTPAGDGQVHVDFYGPDSLRDRITLPLTTLVTPVP